MRTGNIVPRWIYWRPGYVGEKLDNSSISTQSIPVSFSFYTRRRVGGERRAFFKSI